jgi:Mg/Co/Ni transporter MgtE
MYSSSTHPSVRANAKGGEREDESKGTKLNSYSSVDLDLEDLSPSKSKDLVDDNILSEVYARGRWLVGLLVLQSSSSFVLDRYQELLKEHIVVTLFLTMLVGAGGNAGNQSAIKVIRGLATKKMDGSLDNALEVIRQQLVVGLLLGTSLGGAGYLRVYLTNGDTTNALAVSLSLFLIVITSTTLGSTLPFVLNRYNIDPANAGTSIQVVMDILGVTITCFTCNIVFQQLSSSLLN